MTVSSIYELSLAKPGGGEASRESALPTSLLACPSGGWPLNLLEVRIVGTKVACNIRSWQYIVVKKLISSSFRMTVILLRGYMLALPYLAYTTVDLNPADWAASVAQLAEHWTSNQVVTGSNPV